LRARFGILLAMACCLAACVRGPRPPLTPSATSPSPTPLATSASLTGSVVIEGEADANAAGAIVFLEPIPRVAAPEAIDGAQILVRRGRFEPRLLIVQRGQPITWTNLDPIFHGAFSYSSLNAFDLGVYAPNAHRTISLAKAGPVRFHCPIHVDEGGVVFVAPSPHFARAERTAYAIRGVPPGRYWLSAWTDGWVAAAREVTLHAGESAHTDVRMRRERD
jgi:plastocyanin